MIYKEKIEEILELMCVPCHDNGKTFYNFERINNIEKVLMNTSYYLIESNSLFLLYGKKPIEHYGDYLLISSHIDCLQDSHIFSITNEELYRGIFDNAATNAAILLLMCEEKLPDNVYIVFTGDEEKNGGGAKNVTWYLKKRGISFSALVLDVTSEGWDAYKDFTIENLYLNNRNSTLYRVVRFILDRYNNLLFVPKDNLSIEYDIDLRCKCSGTIADWDEACEYSELGMEALSLCLPCSAKDDLVMHSNGGFYIRGSSFVIYLNVLEELVRRFDYEVSNKKS